MADVSFSVMLSSANAAFSESPERELADILDQLSQDIRKGRSGTFNLRDSNGNAVGVATLHIVADEADANA